MDDEHHSSHDQVPLLPNGDVNFDIKNAPLLLSSLQWVLWTTMWLLFLTWLAFIVCYPLSTVYDLISQLTTSATPTFLGIEGAMFLIYSGPILVIAFLSVPYLIISRKLQHQEKKSHPKGPSYRLSTFPVFVQGPLGVVSAAECIGIVLFISYVVWDICVYAVGASAIPLTQSIVSYIFEMAGVSAAATGIFCLAFLLLPISRGSILLRLVNIHFGQAARYHKWIAYLTSFLFLFHGICFMVEWSIEGVLLEEAGVFHSGPIGAPYGPIRISLGFLNVAHLTMSRVYWHRIWNLFYILKWPNSEVANLAGVIAFLILLLIWVTSLPPVKKHYFEIFLYTHYLYILFIVFLAMHVGAILISITAAPILLFMLDRFLRFCQSRKKADIVSTTCFPDGIVKLDLAKPKNLQHNALNFIFLRVRGVSRLQWHPFSLSSSSLDGDQTHLSVLTKPLGGWTEKISEISSSICRADHCLEEHQSLGITAYVEGPYGHEFPHHLMYEKLVLIAGGIGISPFMAVLSDVFHHVKQGKPRLLKDILLVWAVKKSNELSLLSTIDMKSVPPNLSNEVNIEILVYVTQESEPQLEEGVLFDRGIINSFASPVSNISNKMSSLVGTGDIIWCGIYLISTTLGFFLLLSLLNAYYIHPNDIPTGWYQGLLFVVCMVVSVIIFGGFVVGMWHLWNIRCSKTSQLNREDDIKENNDLKTDEDLSQFLAGSMKVRYGSRPDFKDIFESTSESWCNVDVGVIVCGPPTLESTVARECRSFNIWRQPHHPIFHFHGHTYAL